MNLTQVCTLERPPLRLKARTAADLMTPNPVSLREEVTAREAARFLTDRSFGAAPVINEAGEPVGVLSQTDIVVHARERIDSLLGGGDTVEDFSEFAEIPVGCRGVWSGLKPNQVDDKATVGDLMTPTVFTVRHDAPSAQVVEDMLALRVHHLFVVDDGGVLIGVVTATDILRDLAPQDAA
jgi:acetoin utilization protein AcuB